MGQVLTGLRSAGVDAQGLETNADQVASLRTQGFVMHEGDAEALPLGDDAVEWVSIRHVLHHLADPVAALSEAVRVARLGVLVAEPWRDSDVPGQAAGALLDRWMKRQDRRLGREHHEDLTPARIAAELTRLGSFRFEQETHLRTTPADLAAFEQDIDERLLGLGDDHAERSALDPVLALARETGVGLTGTAIVVARGRSGLDAE